MAARDRYNLLALTALKLGILFAAPAVSAETIEAGYRGCEFADAVRAANTNQPVGNCKAGDPGHDHIFVDGVLQLVEPPVLITEDLAIVGDRDTSTLDGGGRFSFFHVGEGVKLHLQDLFMSNGYGTRQTGQARLESGAGIWFSTASVINCKGVKEIVAPDDATVTLGYAASLCGKSEPFNPHPPILPLPGPGDDDDPPATSRDKGRDKSRRAAKAPAERLTKPAVYTCEHLPPNIVVRAFAGARSGIQCQEIDGGGVGVQAVIDRGVIAAVDVWGYVEPGVEVCLRGTGRLLFLDAAFAPRQVTAVAAYRQGDMTCASFNRAGSLVLVVADASAPIAAEETTFVHCTVRTAALLNFRYGPFKGAVLEIIPAGEYLYASARVREWFKVNYRGGEGWVSAKYLDTFGTCE